MGNIECKGGLITELAIDCETIAGSQLVIKEISETELEFLKPLLDKITAIKQGLLLEKNSFSNFSMAQLEYLENDAGSALELKGNTELKHLDFPLLRTMMSKKGEVNLKIDNDKFASNGFNDVESYNDLVKLGIVAGGETCLTSDEMLNVQRPEASSNGESPIFLIISIIYLAIMVSLVLGLWYYSHKKGAVKKGSETIGAESSQQSEQKPIKTPKNGKKAKKMKNA